MKRICILFLLLFSIVVFSQEEQKDNQNMQEAEMKSASKKLAFKVNPNTQNYDITYHKLEFTLDPTVLNIAGKVTTTFKALASMNTITFDLYKTATNPFAITSVKVNNTNATFAHNASHELVITLPTTLPTGSSATVEIIYNGVPATAQGSFTATTHGGSPVIYTLSEPYGARDWWPCKQDLNDKADSIDVYITAPSQYVSVSNGVEPSSPVVSGASKTTHFHHGYPIAAYLIAIAVTNYQVYNQQAGLGTVASPFYPIINYLYPESATTSQSNLAVTPGIINFYETKIGPYPFRNEKYGHAQFGWGGGMEHTTVSFMNSFGRGLIAHEMAHQWFGDKVTCGSWKDIWLNEGITEYMSGCVVENFDGNAAFTTWKNGKINSVTSTTNGNLYLTDAQITNVGRIFSSQMTYNKGSMVTNMLRFKLGDTNFFQGLRNYLSDTNLAYKYAVTPQFQAHMEAVHGSSLQEFFDDWVYNEGYPTYTINAFNSAAGKATIQIYQTQSDPSVSYFEMPVPVRLTGAAGQVQDVVLENTFDGQSFSVNVPFTVTGVVFDPNKNIVSKSNTATLGIGDYNFEAAINVYPNPALDFMTIEMPENVSIEKVSFHNNLGQKSLESNQNKINISGLASGIYVVNLETSKGTYHKKIIKK
jgi:aminopeptidase N